MVLQGRTVCRWAVVGYERRIRLWLKWFVVGIVKWIKRLKFVWKQ